MHTVKFDWGSWYIDRIALDHIYFLPQKNKKKWKRQKEKKKEEEKMNTYINLVIETRSTSASIIAKLETCEYFGLQNCSS